MSGFSLPPARRWRWLDDGVLAYALAVLRSLWLWPLLFLLTDALFPGEQALLAPLAVFGLLAGGTLAAQCGVFLILDRRGALVVALAGLAAVVGALYLGVGWARTPVWDLRWLKAVMELPGRAVLTVFFAAGLWWWGILAGRDRITYDTLARNFNVGLVGLMAVAALSWTAQLLPAGLLLTMLLAYLAVGLFSLALASIQDARRYESGRAGHDLPLARHWWGTVVAVVVALLLVALAVSQLFAPATLGLLAGVTVAVLAFLGQIVVWIIALVSYPILLMLGWLLQLIPMPEGDAPPPQLIIPFNFAEQFGELAERNMAPAAGPQEPLWIIGGLLVAALIVVIFLVAFRRFQVDPEEDVTEAHESILSLDLLKAQLAQLLRRRGGRDGAAPDPFVALRGDEPGVRVRRTYQALLTWASEQGHSRPPGVTPERYQQGLSAAFPGCGEYFDTITTVYEMARYGVAPVTEERAAAADAAWRQIQDHTQQSG